MTRSTMMRTLLGGISCLAALGCRRADDTAADSGPARQVAALAAPAAVSGAVAGRSAAIPADPCTWLTVAEVEEVMGKLTGAPTPTGSGCSYPVTPDSALLAKKTQIRDLVKQLPGAADSARLRDSSWNKAAVIVTVDVAISGVGGRADKVSGQMLTAMTARKGANGDTADSRAAKPEGWDDVKGSFSMFEGRIGHVRVTIRERQMMNRLVQFEKKVALAARVRDRIPDLPFVNPNADPVSSDPSGPDPCSLVSRADAEAVLGPLVVEPYRVGRFEPLAEAGGRSCGYFTRNHHVLIVTPYWSNGKQELALMRGVGKLVSIAAPDADAEAADTLEGPWDEAATDLDGSLVLLAGDRLLRVSYGTSSIDAAQAVRLARPAVERLVRAR